MQSKTNLFAHLSVGEILDLLSQDTLRVKSEDTFVTAAIKWTNEVEDRINVLPEVLRPINLSALNEESKTKLQELISDQQLLEIISSNPESSTG